MPKKLPSRDSVTTINDDGSRFFIHTADVRGFWTKVRRVFGFLLIAVYVLLPWIPINGHPAVFLDAAHGRFHLFGTTIVSQDLWLLFFLISGLGFTLYVVTALFGRIWCGWACPQTVFLDHVFRRIERVIDGDAPARRRLDAAPWTGGKVIKRIVKHAIYFLISFAIANILLSYFVSLPNLYAMMKQSPSEHIGMFSFVMALGLILYGNFAWFREQFCIIMCPYGRLQSALIDDSSVVIGYDGERGEPRGKASDPTKGDCIDCRRCVQVCPTGIDIRQGLQMECIGCSNCIDACDEIMVKLDRPKGLIRYDSLNALNGIPQKILRPRLFAYTVLLLIGAAVFTFATTTRIKPVTFSVLRMQGSPYYMDTSTIRNQYMVRVINKQHYPVEYQLEVEANQPGLTTSGFEESFTVGAEEDISRPLIAVVPLDKFQGTSDVEVTISTVDEKVEISKTIDFMGPDYAIAEPQE